MKFCCQHHFKNKAHFWNERMTSDKLLPSGNCCRIQLCLWSWAQESVVNSVSLQNALESLTSETSWPFLWCYWTFHPRGQAEMKICLQRQRPQPQEVLWEMRLQSKRSEKEGILSRSKGSTKQVYCQGENAPTSLVFSSREAVCWRTPARKKWKNMRT